MSILGSCISLLIFHLASIEAIGVGQAWRVSPYSKTDYSLEHPSWPRLDSSAFEVRTVSGVGRFVPFNDLRSFHNNQIIEKVDNVEPNSLIEQENIERDSREMSQFQDVLTKKSRNVRKDLSLDQKMVEDTVNYPQKIFRTKVSMRVFPIDNWDKSLKTDEKLDKVKEMDNHRVRRETENDTNMEKIGTMLTLREARLASPEIWSKQPLSVEFRHRSNFEQPLRDPNNDEDDTSIGIRNYQGPRADFVTSHYHRRGYPDNRESRDTFVSKTFDDIDLPWYRNMIRERDYDISPIPRRSYSEYYRNYPERNYRMERDYYMRVPNNEHSYYYDRYRDEDLDLYGRSRPTPKPKRIIYYATLPEIVRKPVDLRNYPRTPYHDGGLTRTTVTRGGTFERVPGNVDPSRYRYRHLYDGYDSYSKRSSFYDRPYVGYRDDEDRRKGSIKENLNDHDSGFEASNDRNVVNQIQNRDDGNKLPWPVQIGTEVSVKDDDRIHGRKIFGDTIGFERLQNSPERTSNNETTEKNIN
ncbi:uncharacterized protein LOC122523216 [Polistes fuscatus]|uniref:uncharacterized protein LOC122523216 n=1 Tax=Polistes fuscatus TaxID=30207 RepID=UPI001CAA1AD7|nr:uncharacterized protein LOC122523216 [Polistes fuscatus]